MSKHVSVSGEVGDAANLFRAKRASTTPELSKCWEGALIYLTSLIGVEFG